MSTSLIIDDKFEANIVGYSVQEDSLPLNPLDKTGGVSQLSVSLGEDGHDPALLLNSQVDLSDTMNGQLRVNLDSASGDGFEMSFDGTTYMRRLNSEIYCPPAMAVRLEDYLTVLFNAVGINLTPEYEDAVGDMIVTAIGWRGVLLNKLKDLSAMYQIEIAAIDDRIVVRSMRTRIAEVANVEDVQWQMNHANLVNQLTVVDYRSQAFPTETRVYPDKLGTANVISADAGATVETSLRTEFSLASITIPQYGILPKFDTSVMSIFAVMDGKNKVLSAEEWITSGGTLTAKIDPNDDKVIKVTFRAPRDKGRGPYRLALPESGSGGKDVYGSLRVTGTGVRSVPRDLTMKTGIPLDLVTQAAEAKVDNIFAYNSAKAYHLARTALCFVGTYEYKMSVNTDYVNRRGETGLITSLTYDDFEAGSGTQTYDAFETAQATKTYAQWREEKENSESHQFENQAFGNVGGARREFRGSWWRIRSATITEESISYTAEQDTTYDDVQNAWGGGVTYAQFAAEQGDRTYLEFGVKPLWRE